MTRWHPATFLFAMVLCAAPASAADNLYTGLAYVTGQMEETRLPGFGRALEEVLVKVSGDARLGADPRVAALTEDAASYVETFSYRDRMADIPVHDEQGTRERPFELTVAFVPQKIDALLATLGEAPWTDRPAVVVLTTVTTGGGLHYPLTSDGQNGRDFRDALAAEARRAGLTVSLPAEADAATAGTVPSGAIVLRGAIAWNDAERGWRADWGFAKGNDAHVWRLSGVSFDAAFRSGLRGVAQVLSGNGEPQ